MPADLRMLVIQPQKHFRFVEGIQTGQGIQRVHPALGRFGVFHKFNQRRNGGVVPAFVEQSGGRFPMPGVGVIQDGDQLLRSAEC